MIYFIKAEDNIKIGYSSNPYQRLLTLQTGNPHKLKLLGIIQGEFLTEKLVHDIFKKYRRRNSEWFKHVGHLERCMQALCDPHNIHKITDIKSLQLAGLNLHLRKKSNRLGENHKLSKEIKQVKSKNTCTSFGHSQIGMVTY